MRRTIVYIDGFNLFYGALRNTPHKWLNPYALAQLVLKNHTITAIKYFTALVQPRPQDPDQPVRQQAYLRALATLPQVEIIYGHFLSHPVTMRLVQPPSSGSPYVSVMKTEEKGSDVNLATHLMHDAHMKRMEVAVLITNDSDLVEPIRLLRRDLKLTIGVLNPHKKPAAEIMKAATFIRPIRAGVLAASQFPVQLTDARGIFHKPQSW